MQKRGTTVALAVIGALVVPVVGVGLTTARASATVPTVTIDAAAGKDGRRAINRPIAVTVANGTLYSVTGSALPLGVTSPSRAKAVRGSTSADRTSWRSTRLLPARIYRLTVAAVAADGVTTVTRTTSVRTKSPKKRFSYSISPSRGSKVGVGMPITVRLSREARSQRAKANVERALVVSSSKPVATGSWGWLSDTMLEYRPKAFWPAASKIRVRAKLDGVGIGRGIWATKDTTQRFQVGRRQVMRVDGVRHTFVIKRNGHVVRRGGVSLGKPGFTTRSGIKVIMTREVSRRMRSSTIGITSGANAYDLMVPYAMRVTNSGEFVHGAPWNSHIGVANVSHGCTNLTLTNAIWLYHHSLIGDPVITTGTSRSTELTSGLGGLWNLSWAAWTKRSALR